MVRGNAQVVCETRTVYTSTHYLSSVPRWMDQLAAGGTPTIADSEWTGTEYLSGHISASSSLVRVVYRLE